MPTIQNRRATKSQWSLLNPVLAAGEVGVELGDTLKFKMGNGLTPWDDLKYFVDETGIMSLEILETGRLSEESLNGTYAPADVAEGLVSEDTYRFVGLPTFFHDFVGMTAGATAPTVSDSGDEVYWDSAAPYFTGNDFTTFNPGAATYFCTEDLGAKVTHVGARFKYAPNGGGNSGLVCIAITDRRWTVANVANTNMGVHFWCTPTSWALTVWVAGVGQVGVLDGTYKDGMRLTADGTTEYMMQCWIAGNKATIILPDGVRRVAIDERFTSLAGNFAFFESMPNAANDDLACISTVRAGIGKTRAPWPV